MKKPIRYAEGTSVPAEKTQFEIRQLIGRHGAEGFAYAETPKLARIEFMTRGRRIRFELAMPQLDAALYTPGDRERGAQYRELFGKSRYWRTDATAHAIREQEIRRLWRCLLLCIKSKFEVVATGMAIFEEEFLVNIVLPDGRTAGDHVVPAIARAYETGRVVGLLGTGE
jgi:hypothetical protein